jgi:GDPmannose 4,6-dehydratase
MLQAEKSILVVGSGGQDGSILKNLLAQRGGKFFGQSRDKITGPGNKVLGAPSNNLLIELISKEHFSEIYFLAAVHSPAVTPRDTTPKHQFTEQLNLLSDQLLVMLEAIRVHSPQTKFFFASSALIYGMPTTFPQSEMTPPNPIEPYSLFKKISQDIIRFYRETLGLFGVSGILFPHESEFRQDIFLFRKILNAAQNIGNGQREILEIANLDFTREWNCAYQTMEAVLHLMNLDESSDFVIGSGIQKSVREVCEIAFNNYGIDYKKHVVQSGISTLPRSSLLIADPSKLRGAIGFAPDGDVQALISRVSKKLEE